MRRVQHFIVCGGAKECQFDDIGGLPAGGFFSRLENIVSTKNKSDRSNKNFD
jgi:hypothetical protein